MRHAFVLGTFLAVSAATASFAQSAPAPASTTSVDELKPHMKSGAAIYDPAGKEVGSIASVDYDHGVILIHESSFMGASTILRQLPIDTVSWTNNRLQTTIPQRQISKLKSG